MRIQETVTVAVMALILTLMSPTAYAQEKESDSWEFSLAPYIWAVGIKGDMVIKGAPLEVDVDFDELFDEVDFAMELHFEARKGDWVFIADPTIIRVETEAQLGPATVDVEMDYDLADFLVGYRLNPRWELLGGVRYWSLDVTVDPGPLPDVNEGESWVDLVVGGRFNWPLSEKWAFISRADIGGFGIGSSSDSTWSVSGLFARKYKNTDLLVGYRHLDVDYETGSGINRFEFDVEQSGPMVGLNFRWPRQ